MNEQTSIQGDDLDTDFGMRVAAYLRRHPEFFMHYTALAETLMIPHPCEPAVSLLEYQNRLLRERNQRLHETLRDFVTIARENDRLAERVQRLALGLLDARGELDALLHGIKAILRDEFNADAVSLCLSIPPSHGLEAVAEFLRPDVLGLFDEVFRIGRPQCGPLSTDQAGALFGEHADQVASAALILLGGHAWHGLLAVGSSDPARFHPSVGTLFLERIGELITQTVHARLRANASFPEREHTLVNV